MKPPAYDDEQQTPSDYYKRRPRPPVNPPGPMDAPSLPSEDEELGSDRRIFSGDPDVYKERYPFQSQREYSSDGSDYEERPPPPSRGRKPIHHRPPPAQEALDSRVDDGADGRQGRRKF